jgi:hypothetical protein
MDDVEIYQTGDVLVSGKVPKEGNLPEGSSSEDDLVEDAIRTHKINRQLLRPSIRFKTWRGERSD